MLRDSFRRDIRPFKLRRGFVVCRQRYWLLSGVLALFLTAMVNYVSAALLPEPFTANYLGKKYIATARAKIELIREGDYFKYTMVSKVKVKVLFLSYENRAYDCSVMRVFNGGVNPIEHKHIESRDTEYNAHTVFDWETNIASVNFDHEDDVVSLSLEQATWDPMSLQVQLMIDAMNGELHAGKTYTILEDGVKSGYNMATLGEETIHNVLGAVDTLKIGSPSSDHGNRFWLSLEHDYIPVRMEISGVRVELISNIGTAVNSANDESSIGNYGAIPRCSDRQ